MKNSYKMKDGINIRDDGAICYVKNRKYHREDGPAIILEGQYRCWLQNDVYYRLDGPAVEDDNGYKEWHVDDKVFFTEEEYRMWKIKTFS
jgi:hypothetical protein